MDPTEHDPRPPILRIPPEIRLKIYDCYLRSLSAYAHADDQPTCALNTVPKPPQHVDLLLAYGVFYTEANPLIAEYVNFRVAGCACYNKPTNIVSLRSMRYVELGPLRYGHSYDATRAVNVIRYATACVGRGFRIRRLDTRIHVFVDGSEEFDVNVFMETADLVTFTMWRWTINSFTSKLCAPEVQIEVDRASNVRIVQEYTDFGTNLCESAQSWLVSKGFFEAEKIAIVNSQKVVQQPFWTWTTSPTASFCLRTETS